MHINWIYHAECLISCNHIKCTRVHPSFSEKLRKTIKKSKHTFTKWDKYTRFFAFFCISTISQFFFQITLLDNGRKLKIETNELSEFFFSGKIFTSLIFFSDPSPWFHQTTKKVGSADNIFFLVITLFFCEFPILDGKYKKKMLSLL